MKVYDIVNEVQSVGKGDYAGFVWDQPSGSRNITVKFPDGRTTTVTNQADARRVADEWRTRNNGSTTGPAADTDRSRTGSRPTVGSNVRASFNFRNVSRLAGAVGGIILSVQLYSEIEEQMKRLWDARQSGEIRTQEAYERAVSAAFGTWVAAAAPTTVAAFASLGRHALMPIVRTLRGINAASSAAAASTGILAIPSLIKFILWEVGVWVAVYYISTRKDAQEWLASWIYGELWVKIAEAMEVGADTVVNGKSAIERAIGKPQAPDRQETVRARTLAGLDPELLATAAADEIEDEAASRETNNRQSNTAQGTRNATSQSQNNQGSTSGTNWMMPPELRSR